MPRFLTLAVVLCLALSTVALSEAEKRVNKHKAQPARHNQHPPKSLVPAKHHGLEEVPDYVVRQSNAAYLYYTMTWDELNYVYQAGLYIRFGLLAGLRHEATNQLGRGHAHYMGRPEILLDRIFHTAQVTPRDVNYVLNHVADNLGVTDKYKGLHARAAMIHSFQEALLDAANTGLAHHVDETQDFAFLVAARQTEGIQTYRALTASPWGAYITPADGNTNAVVFSAPTATYQAHDALGATVSRRNLAVAVVAQGIRGIRQHRLTATGAGAVTATGTLVARLTRRDWLLLKINPLVARLHALMLAIAGLADETTCDEAEVRTPLPDIIPFVDFTYPEVNTILENALESIATLDAALTKACEGANRRGDLEDQQEILEDRVSIFKSLASRLSKAFS